MPSPHQPWPSQDHQWWGWVEISGGGGGAPGLHGYHSVQHLRHVLERKLASCQEKAGLQALSPGLALQPCLCFLAQPHQAPSSLASTPPERGVCLRFPARGIRGDSKHLAAERTNPNRLIPPSVHFSLLEVAGTPWCFITCATPSQGSLNELSNVGSPLLSTPDGCICPKKAEALNTPDLSTGQSYKEGEWKSLRADSGSVLIGSQKGSERLAFPSSPALNLSPLAHTWQFTGNV